MIKARFNSKHCKLTIIQCYAPTNEAEREDKDDWYEELQRIVSKVPQHDVLLIMGDMNAKGQRGRQLNIGKLKCQNINKEFVLELRNCFGALGALADSTDEDPDIHTKWETIKNTYVEAATKILGYRDKKNKE
ncbi:hypothetical protein AAFF_G00116890 [Aldrovandia affinis]|uniref:Uncharacterized protein n=1 Tax=Aldrovandia affinis TaxID=143900 RepID=A0AAD7WXM9_9TELE|nr:hypothetical protein AAFF_G00116890 [Aldrovandia affinis]